MPKKKVTEAVEETAQEILRYYERVHPSSGVMH